MTETKLPEELEEQAMLYALGVLDKEDRRAFEVRLQGESDLLRQAVRAYCMITGTLGDTVIPVMPPPTLRARVVTHIALEGRREAEQFEIIANTLASSTSSLKPRDAIRTQLLSRIEAHSNVHVDDKDSVSALSDMSAVAFGGEGQKQRRPLPQQTGVQSGWLGSCWTALSNFLRTLLIRSMVPRPSAQGLTFVKASEGTWRGIAPGVMAKLLSFDSTSQRTTALLRFAPGKRYAPHRHTAVEELYVLEGGCSIAGREMTVGDYHRAEAGTLHDDTSTDEGCLLLVISSPQNELLK